MPGTSPNRSALRATAAAALGLTTLTVLAFVAFGTQRAPARAPALETAPAALPEPSTDTDYRRMNVVAPAIVPDPERPKAAAPAPRPRVDWNALAVGVAEAGVRGATVARASHADLETGLSEAECRAITAAADAGATKPRGFGGGIAVVGRGTPRGSGDCP